MKKALLPSYKMADQPTLTLGNMAVTSLTGNPEYANPSPSLAIVQGAIDTYSAALYAAQYGGREQKAQKNAAKQNLISILRQLCDWINTVSQGSLTMLAGCGFPLSKDPQPSSLGTPELKVVNGASGQLVASTPAVQAAVAYMFRYRAEPSTAAWSEILSSRATCKIDGLQPGVLYSVGMTAIGTNDQVTTSEIVTKMVA